ncbi:MAG: 50S ribosomal protein L32, partial [Patescibacteria group bacterium]|nr:50S ribosomal protein L32 [Patescibacteria group bacterium]
MPPPVKHHSKSKVGRRRAHIARKPVGLVPCPQCKSPMLPHRACAKCGYYAGKVFS